MCTEADAAESRPGFGQRMRSHLEEVERCNVEQVEWIAGRLLECVVQQGLIFTGGAGHSLGAVSETFYRAGGLACVRPLYAPQLWPLHGAKASTRAERRPGFASDVLGSTDIGAKDVLIVFSNSGVNPYPVELAQHARHLQCDVVAVTSMAAMSAAPQRAEGKLIDYATYLLDTMVPAGDAAYPEEQPRTGPLSSLANTYLWNVLLAELIDRAAQANIELPLWHSTNVPGGDSPNDTLAGQYATRIPELSPESGETKVWRSRRD